MCSHSHALDFVCGSLRQCRRRAFHAGARAGVIQSSTFFNASAGAPYVAPNGTWYSPYFPSSPQSEVQPAASIKASKANADITWMFILCVLYTLLTGGLSST